ncbi:MAG: hypothetical protein R3F11_20325 [Verrucomicrobiales bacterium]
MIRTNASGEETFTFRVDGVGTAGELQVRQILLDGFGPPIPDGDTSPSLEDGTAWRVNLDGITDYYYHTFEFLNTGNDTLPSWV